MNLVINVLMIIALITFVGSLIYALAKSQFTDASNIFVSIMAVMDALWPDSLEFVIPIIQIITLVIVAGLFWLIKRKKLTWG